MKLRVLSLFSGIGAFEKALTNLGVDYELVGFCEIDKYAAQAYCAVHGVSEDLNLKDVRAIDTSKLHDIDLITYGFPCQDISQAGKQKGFTDTDGNLTRSGLFFEALRIIKDLKPAYAIAENVKALTSKKFEREFEIVRSSLNEAGYNNYTKVLNASDFGIPQNRERVFIVSIRKDIDDYSFNFPAGGVLAKCLYDFLEHEVDESFYKTDEKSLALIKKLQQEGYEPYPSKNILQVGNIAAEKTFKNPQIGRVYAPEGIAPTLNCCEGGDRQVKIIESKIKVIGMYSAYQRGKILDGGGISQCLEARDFKDPIRVTVWSCEE